RQRLAELDQCLQIFALFPRQGTPVVSVHECLQAAVGLRREAQVGHRLHHLPRSLHDGHKPDLPRMTDRRDTAIIPIFGGFRWPPWPARGIYETEPAHGLSATAMQITLTVTAGPHQGRVFTFAGHDTFMV